MNLVAAEVAAGETGPVLRAGATAVTLPAAAPVRPGDRVTYGFRPEHVALAPEGEGDLMATVDFAEQLGGETYLYCSADGIGQLTLHQTGQLPVTRGQQLALRLDRSRMHLFDADGAVIVNGLSDV